MKERNLIQLVFGVQILARLIFCLTIGFFNNYSLQSDSIWLVKLADKTLHGNFDYTLARFIASPFFPFMCGLFKIFFQQYWAFCLIIFQILLASFSGIYVYKIAKLLFSNVSVSLIAALLFAIYPPTLWYTHTFSQESLFQSMFIMSFYYLLESLVKPNIKNIIVSAILFSLAFLTKSHILLFYLFIPLLYMLRYGTTIRTATYCLLFSGICLLLSLPYGLYHKRINQTFVVSSNGAGYQFYLGNTEAGYISIVDVPNKNSIDYKKMKDINSTAGYFNGSEVRYDSLLHLPQNVKQHLFLLEALEWIKSNPTKFIKLKLYDIIFYLMPGVSWRHYPFKQWLLSFVISAPIFAFAFISIIRQLKLNFAITLPVLSVFLSMAFFSVVWYVQNRFRTITLDPLLLVYAAYPMYQIAKRFVWLRNLFSFIDTFNNQN